jgi:hypothetical protein
MGSPRVSQSARLIPSQALSFDGSDKRFGPPDAASSRFRLDCVHLFR